MLIMIPRFSVFSINRYTGTGVAEGGAIRFTPFVEYSTARNLERKRFVVDKKTEKAHAGYYSVYLHQEEIKVELTASNHAGMHRYEFETDDPYISVNLTGAHKGSMKDVSATVAGAGVFRKWPDVERFFAEVFWLAYIF
jgi:putative alpha-1,2-mannosidase